MKSGWLFWERRSIESQLCTTLNRPLFNDGSDRSPERAALRDPEEVREEKRKDDKLPMQTRLIRDSAHQTFCTIWESELCNGGIGHVS